MIWAQWTVLILSCAGFILNTHEEVVRTQRPIIRNVQGADLAVVGIVLRLLVLYILIATGAFSQILGWPHP